MGLVSSGKKSLRHGLIALCSFLRRSGEREAPCFSLVSNDKIYGTGSSCIKEVPARHEEKHFSKRRIVRHWNRLPAVASCLNACLWHSNNILNYTFNSGSVQKQSDSQASPSQGPFQLKLLSLQRCKDLRGS